MAFQSLVTANLNFAVLAGNCLAMSQGIVGAPVMHNSATEAANATQFRHLDTNIPNAICILWFDHWGTYGSPGNMQYKNWGHVVVYVPGYGYASSSPYANQVSTPYFYASIHDVERTFNCSYRFWTEDINYKRVCVPAPAPGIKWEDTLQFFNRYAKRTAEQVIQPEAINRLFFNDKNDVTFASGTGDVVGVTASVRLKGNPGGRVEVTMVKETVSGKENTKTYRVSQARAIFDTLGLAGVNLSGNTVLKNQRMRVLVQGSPEAGPMTVKRYEVSGFANTK